jgi:GTPase SAR1 family protein
VPALVNLFSINKQTTIHKLFPSISGKTNCVLRFVNGQFRENYIPTIEDTYRQVVSCNKQITTLQITDTYVEENIICLIV